MHIDAPPEVVLDEVSHVERHASWANPTAEAIEQTAGDGPAPPRTTLARIFVKKPVSADIDVTRYEPPQLSRWPTQHQTARRTCIRHTSLHA